MRERERGTREMPLVLIESPFAGDLETNIQFARACMRDSLLKGEAPFAMHLLYTQEGILNDDIPEERKWGMDAGFIWGQHADISVVYTNLGISPGMEIGIQRAQKEGRDIEYRELDSWTS